jgi:hypothetical protein
MPGLQCVNIQAARITDVRVLNNPRHLKKFLCRTSKFDSSVQPGVHESKQAVCFEGMINPSHVINSNTIFRELSGDK